MNKEMDLGSFYSEAKPKSDEPKDVKIARFSSKLDIIQIGAGGVAAGVGAIIGAPFLIPLGLGYVAFNGAEYVGTKAYIKYRMDRHKKNQGAGSAQAESRTISFRSIYHQTLPKAA